MAAEATITVEVGVGVAMAGTAVGVEGETGGACREPDGKSDEPKRIDPLSPSSVECNILGFKDTFCSDPTCH